MTALAIILAAAIEATPLAPTRLRASGSDWSSTAAHTRFALEHDHRPTFTWAPHHPVNSQRRSRQSAYELEIFDAAGTRHWRSGKVASANPRMVYPPSAPPLLPAATYTWHVASFDGEGVRSPTAPPSAFHVAPSPAAWKNVSWLGDATSNVYRTSFSMSNSSDVTGVTLYVCGLGFSVVKFNGHDLNTLTTAPWTNNARVNGFSSYDVTGLLSSSSGSVSSLANTIVVSLGNGWRDTKTFAVKDPDDRTHQGQYWRMLRAKVVATTVNGATVTLVDTGDGSWSAAQGPSTYDSVYNGEHYDSRIAHRLEEEATRVGGSLWTAAQVASGPTGEMVAWAVPPVEVLATVAPVHVSNPKPSLYVVDFGERRAGVVRLKGLVCASGSTIVLRHAEIMQHDGLPDLKPADPSMIYVGELRSAKQTDEYICSGASGGETWAPQLTYHGFRYVEVNVSAAPGVVITADSLEMVHFASALKQRSHVHFSSVTLNKIQAMAVGSQRSNLMTIPTDCDQRDERLGWMGDANLSGESMALNFDLAAFFSWWVRYVAVPEVSETDGSLPDVVPFYRYGNRPGDVSWSTALPNIIYQLWKIYGDLETYRGVGRGAVAAQLANLGAQATKGLDKLNTPYGDWCSPPAKMGAGHQGEKPSQPLTSAYSYIHMVQQATSMAAAVGNTSEATRLRALNKQLLSQYNSLYHKGSGAYDTGTQTALALALAIGAPPALNETQDALLAAVTAKGTHSYTGIIGSSQIFAMLDGARAHDTALAILSQTSYPSFGFGFANSLEKTTTNLWELPDAVLEGTGMNSRNHHMYSSYSAYLVRSVAGLSQAASSSGYQQLELRPSAAYALHSASATLELPNGDVRFEWVRSGGTQYDKVAEGDSASLSCGPRGGVITRVAFSSFGTPTTGEAAEMTLVQSECHSPRSADVVAKQCLGRAECSVAASRSLFSFSDADVERCHADARDALADPLRLWVAVVCERADAIDASVSIPVGARATVRLPVRYMASPELRNGGEVVHSHGLAVAMVKRVHGEMVEAADEEAGVRREMDEQMGEVLAVSLGAGEYALVLSDADQ